MLILPVDLFVLTDFEDDVIGNVLEDLTSKVHDSFVLNALHRQLHVEDLLVKLQVRMLEVDRVATLKVAEERKVSSWLISVPSQIFLPMKVHMAVRTELLRLVSSCRVGVSEWKCPSRATL